MRAEIIAIGTEILLGQLVDTNSAWIATELSKVGIDCHYQSTIGDNIETIASAIKQAQTRADIIICTGGLGPTQDDVTKEALAKAIDRPLIFDETLAQKINDKFTRRNIAMSQNNLRQAYYPKGTTILSAHPGTAPGINYYKNNQFIFLMPGVPNEMKTMMNESILPLLKETFDLTQTIVTETLKAWGLPESDIAEKLDDLNTELEAKGNPKLSFLASGINGINIRLSAKADNDKAALALIAPYLQKAKILLGETIYGSNGDSMESVVADLLNKNHLSLCLLESFSGGMITSRLNVFTDAATYLKGALVMQSDNNIIEQLTATKQQFVADIALTICQNSVDLHNKMITLTVHALIHERCYTKSVQLPYYNHNYTMEFSVITALNFLRLSLHSYLQQSLKENRL